MSRFHYGSHAERNARRYGYNVRDVYGRASLPVIFARKMEIKSGSYRVR